MKTRKKLLSLLLAVVLCLGLLPTAAFAADTAGITEGKTDLIVASSSSGENTSVVAFGGYEWYVIGYNGSGVNSTAGDNTVTLLAKEDKFGDSAFRPSTRGTQTDGYTQWSGDNWYYANNPDGSSWTNPNEYAGSTLQQKMESIASGFSSAEQSLINARNFTGGGTYQSPSTDGIAGPGLTGQKVWSLSSDEWNTINNKTVRSYGAGWWLRSPHADDGYYAMQGHFSGGHTLGLYYVYDKSVAVRPALSLNLSAVMFTSAAEGGKSAPVGSAVGATAPTTGTIKYTFQSDSHTLTSAVVRETDSGLVLDYSGATTGASQYVSFVLKDSNGDVKCYGKIADSSTSGSGQGVSIPLTGVADGDYTLSIFSEQINSDKNSDFASAPIETSIEIKNSKASLKRYTVEIPVTVKVEQGGSVAAPEESFDIEAEYGMEIQDGEGAAYLKDLLANEVKIETSGEPVETNGAGEYTGAKVTVSFTETAWHALMADGGVNITQKSGSTDGWEYDGLGYHVYLGQNYTTGAYEVSSYEYFSETDPVPIGVNPEKVLFTNTYTKDNTGGEGGGTTPVTPVTEKYTITAEAGTGGTISPTGSTEVTKGGSQTFTIAANSGYKISDVKIDGRSVGAVTSYTFSNVQAAHTIEAAFEKTETTNPTNPTTPTEDNKTNPDTGGTTTDVDVPQTGDSSNLALWIGLLALAAAGLTGTVIYGRKRNFNR